LVKAAAPAEPVAPAAPVASLEPAIPSEPFATVEKPPREPKGEKAPKVPRNSRQRKPTGEVKADVNEETIEVVAKEIVPEPVVEKKTIGIETAAAIIALKFPRKKSIRPNRISTRGR